MSSLAPFSFTTAPHVVCEPGATAQLPALLARYFPQVRKLLIITSPDFVHGELPGRLITMLKDAGMAVDVFPEVTSVPTEALALRAAGEAQRRETELVLGCGDRHVMDLAKLVAVLAPTRHNLAGMYGLDKITGERLSLIQVPTSLSMGAEAMPIAFVRADEITQRPVISHRIHADLVLLDACLTLESPPRATAAAGIAAMALAIEAYTSPLKKNPLSDMAARQALHFLSAHLVTACRDSSNLSARQAMLLGAMLAGLAFANAPTGTLHALTAPIDAFFPVQQGLSSTFVLPHALRFHSPVAMRLYAELAEIIAPGASGSEEARTEALIGRIVGLALETGIETRLREVGAAESDLDRLVEAALLQIQQLPDNGCALSRFDARAIYAAAL